jgi:hypothetical protein
MERALDGHALGEFYLDAVTLHNIKDRVPPTHSGVGGGGK